MPEKWTAELVASLHMHGITAKELAAKAGINPKYMSTILNGHVSPRGAREKLTRSLADLIKEKNLGTVDEMECSELEYAKGVLSGLLNFSIRSGLTVGDGCGSCGENIPETERTPAYRCRCGYEDALRTAIRCIDKEIGTA